MQNTESRVKTPNTPAVSPAVQQKDWSKNETLYVNGIPLKGIAGQRIQDALRDEWSKGFFAGEVKGFKDGRAASHRNIIAGLKALLHSLEHEY